MKMQLRDNADSLGIHTMNDNVIRLPTPKERRKTKARNVTLCRNGHHKWAVVDTPFDVASGKLITRLRCGRCGQERTEAR